ncbi:MAG: phosphopyruvate hydratase [Patescibacteria group bacterium]|jgi:enolase
MKIKEIFAEEILDSRGSPTISATVILEDGSIGISMVPSGASTGSYEAVELRDGDLDRYNGTGVLKAVENVNKIISYKLAGQDAANQKQLDDIMIKLDGTENKSKLGANAILAVSMACARAEAISEKLPLYEYLTKMNPEFNGKYIMPIPQMNIMNGGKHANWATDIQEYLILPIGAKNIREAVRMCTEIYSHLKRVVKNRGYSTGVGDEGGFAPDVKSNEEPFILIKEAVGAVHYLFGEDVVLGIDAAATEFYTDGQYDLRKEAKAMDSLDLGEFYGELAKRYPIVSFEDVFAEDDWAGFAAFYKKFPKKQIVGDDLYVTNIKRLKKGISEKVCNSVLIKLNQIGTVSETAEAIIMARANGMTSIISHRSGETEDTFIADFAVAMGTGQIKTGAPCRSERTAKYNRLMMIERELGKKAEYAKWPF